MAKFASLAAAETRLKAKIADGTWINGYCAIATLESAGTPLFCVRVQRKMSNASAGSAQAGGYVEITDDATV